MFQNMAEFMDTIYPGEMRTATEFLKALTLKRGASQAEQRKITKDPFNPAWGSTASEYLILQNVAQFYDMFISSDDTGYRGALWHCRSSC